MADKEVNTNGGTFVGKDVTTSGDFVGRDKITYQTINNYTLQDHREDDGIGAVGKRNELLAFKNAFMLHAPPSETDASLGYGNPEIEVRDIANAFCNVVAQKFDLFLPVYKLHSHLLPVESVSCLTRWPGESKLVGCTGRTSFETLIC